jgi:hypothetical protein
LIGGAFAAGIMFLMWRMNRAFSTSLKRVYVKTYDAGNFSRFVYVYRKCGKRHLHLLADEWGEDEVRSPIAKPVKTK